MKRGLLAIVVAIPLFAAEPRETIRKLAESLTDDDEARFLSLLDESAPDELTQKARALIRQNNVTSSIVFLSEEGDGPARIYRLDWLIDARPRSTVGPFHRRRVAALVEVVLDRKKRWRVRRIEPQALLDAPPAARP